MLLGSDVEFANGTELCCSLAEISKNAHMLTFQIAFLSCQKVIQMGKQTWSSNDKTIFEPGYRKIS